MTTNYDPHANLDTWLADGWETGDECDVAGVFVKPADPGKGWGASFGTWQQQHPQLHGFASSWEAWAFVFAATGIDAHARLPASVRQYESQPQPDTLEEMEPTPAPYAQFRLFAEAA